MAVCPFKSSYDKLAACTANCGLLVNGCCAFSILAKKALQDLENKQAEPSNIKPQSDKQKKLTT